MYDNMSRTLHSNCNEKQIMNTLMNFADLHDLTVYELSPHTPFGFDLPWEDSEGNPIMIAISMENTLYEMRIIVCETMKYRKINLLSKPKRNHDKVYDFTRYMFEDLVDRVENMQEPLPFSLERR